MSKAPQAAHVLLDEWACDASASERITSWLEGVEAAGDDPLMAAEGMAVKVRSLDQTKSPVGFILWAIREGEDYSSMAPKHGFESELVRRVAKSISRREKPPYTYVALMEIHARGGIPWHIVNICSPQFVERALQQLREHAQKYGFPGIRVNLRTPSLHEGEWGWEPLASGYVQPVVDAGGERSDVQEWTSGPVHRAGEGQAEQPVRQGLVPPDETWTVWQT